VTILTVGSLARRIVDLFWPLIAEEIDDEKKRQKTAWLATATPAGNRAQDWPSQTSIHQAA